MRRLGRHSHGASFSVPACGGCAAVSLLPFAVPSPFVLQNLVRDATSNTNELPSPAQMSRIGEACAYSDSYHLVFAQLHRRLTHLEYKRHVIKALLVLDYLIRLKPPSPAVQLKLIVDVKENWRDVYRLAKLRVQSSSETIQQIQRVAERLCDFIWRFEQGEVEAGAGAAAEEETRRKRKKKKRAKKRVNKRAAAASESESSSSTSTSSSSSDSDGGLEGDGELRLRVDGGGGGAPSKDLLSPSRIPNFGALGASSGGAQKQAPAVSPFGCDFGFWSDRPQGELSYPSQAQPQKSAPASQSQQQGLGSLGPRPSVDPFADLDKQAASWQPKWSPMAPPVGGASGSGSGMPALEAVDWVCSRCTYQNPSD